MNSVRTGVAAALWAVAVVLLVVASVGLGHRALYAWAIVVALIAHAVTMWAVVIHERMRVEDIARLLTRTAQRAGLHEVT